MKTNFLPDEVRAECVLFAEWAGWLSFVDETVVSSYLARAHRTTLLKTVLHLVPKLFWTGIIAFVAIRWYLSFPVFTLASALTLASSPAGQIAAGGALFWIVETFFSRVDAVLSTATKSEIAGYLLNVIPSQKADVLADTFIVMFDRVFGEKHLSWSCFARSAIVSTASVILCMFLTVFNSQPPDGVALASIYGIAGPRMLLVSLVANLPLDYLSLLETRFVLGLMARWRSFIAGGFLIVMDFLFTSSVSVLVVALGLVILVSVFESYSSFGELWMRVAGSINYDSILSGMLSHLRSPARVVWYAPAFVTSVWLWLYFGSSLLLKVARRLDVGIMWFNRSVDIEKKPLSAVGLVAGALVAVIYWSAAIFSHFVS